MRTYISPLFFYPLDMSSRYEMLSTKNVIFEFHKISRIGHDTMYTNEPSDSLTNKYTKRRKEGHGTAYWCKKLVYAHGLPSIIVYILF